MNENISSNNINKEEVEIDLSQLFKLLKKSLRLIIVCAVLGAIIAFAFTMFFIEKKYSSQARIYLIPRVTEQGNVDLNAVSTNSKLVNNYVSLMKGENILSKVAEKLELTSVDEVKKSLSVTNEENTEIIAVTATTNNPTKSKQIAEATVSIFYSEMKENLKIDNMTTVDSPKINNSPVSPNKKVNTVIGALAGIVISCGFVFLKYLLDKRLRNRTEAENFLNIPVLAEIPFFDED